MNRRSRRGAKTAVCFGEVLWDCLPKGLFLGGAPMNVAYHLAHQGFHVRPVTSVGRDFLGDEAVRRITGWGLDPRTISRDAKRATGTVRAALDRSGSATYHITRDVAWDQIKVPPGISRVKPAPAVLVYGTLALREKPNRRALAFLARAWPRTLRVVDLNFRAPFDTAEVTAFALAHAQLVKLNDSELTKLTGAKSRSPVELGRTVRQFALKHAMKYVCVTAGARGAGLWWGGEWYWENARPVTVRDTVGAGDAFLSALLGSLVMREESPERALAQACRLGEFVAAQDGATPAYRLNKHHRPALLSPV